MGLTVRDDDEPTGSGLGAAAAFLALIGAAIGALRYWQDLSVTWAWIGLGFGAFAIGIALVRLVNGQLKDFGDILHALGALAMGAGAIAGVMVPIAPAIGFGFWAGSWALTLFFFE